MQRSSSKFCPSPSCTKRSGPMVATRSLIHGLVVERLCSDDSPKKVPDLSWVPDRLGLGIHRLPIEQSICSVSDPAIKSRTVYEADLSKTASNTEESPTNDDPWGENDETEYVGVDDEKVFHADLISDRENEFDYIPDSDEDNDDCVVDGEQGCEIVDHVTNLENPKIEVGVTFEDGQTFKRAIRQYAILNEIEISAPYSEAKRYRGYCKAKKCTWRIHASQLQDGRTWMIKKIPNKHYCKSTSKLKSNCMADQFWVRDRVVQWLREDPTIGPAAL